MSMKVKSSVTYTQLSYIESTGTQFIDTGFVPNNNTRVVIDFEIISQPINVYYTIFSSRSNSYSDAYCIFSQNHTVAPNTILDSYGTNRDVTLQYSLIGRHVIDKNKNNVILDNTTIYQHDYNEFNSVCELRILADNKPDGGDGHYFVGKLYSCQIYDNDILIRDYIPVIDYKNIICLFDKVHGQFYYNSGTGNFVSGEVVETVMTDAWVEGKECYYKTNDNIWQKPQSMFVKVSDSYTPVDYIESTGTQWIDTGVKATENTKVDVQFQYLSNSGGQQVISMYTTWIDDGFAISSDIIAFDEQLHYHNLREDGKWHEVVLDKGKCYIDNALKATLTSNGFVTQKTLTMFARDGQERLTGRISYCKIYESDVLIRDFIPVVDKNGVACMYDKVHGQFYYNQGTGDFIAAETSHVEVEYLESTGTQYIDTKISDANGFKTEMTIMYTDYYTSGYMACIGCHESASPWKANFIRIYDSSLWNLGAVDMPMYTSPTGVTNQQYFIEGSTLVGNSYLIIDGSPILSSSSTEERSLNNVLLFGLNAGSSPAQCSKMKLYSCKIYNNNNIIIRDYIPVRDKNNVPCLYDKVEGKYYYNQGTGEFLAPTKGYTELEYIESNGNSYIDTKYNPNGNSKIEFSFLDSKTTGVMFGSYNTGWDDGVGLYTNALEYGDYWYHYLGNHNTLAKYKNSAIIETDKGTVLINNSVVFEYETKSFSVNYPMYIFAGNFAGNNVEQPTSYKLLYFKIYDNGVLIRDFIPVKDYKGIPCLYDKVYNRYYYDENNYGFTGGKIAGCFGWKQVI